MAVTISYQTTVTSAVASSGYSLAYTAASAAGQERLLAICSISDGDVAGLTYGSVAIDGQSATQVGSYARGPEGSGSNGAVVAMFRAAGTASTSFNVTFTCSDVPFDARTFLWTLAGADTVLDTATSVGVPGNPGPNVLLLDVDTVIDGGVAAAALAYVASPTTFAWTGLTERFDGGAIFTIDAHTAADANISSTSTPLAVTALTDNVGISSEAAAGVAISFNPNSGLFTLLAGSYAATGVAAPMAYLFVAESG